MLVRHLYCLSGVTLVLGAVALFASSLLRALMFPGENPMQTAEPARVVLDLLRACAAVLLLFGLPAVYVRWRTGYGALGFIGSIGIGLTLMLLGFFSLVSALILPSLLAQAPQLLATDPLSLTTLAMLDLALGTIGPILLAIPSIERRAGAPPGWIGWAWLLCGVLAPIGVFTTGTDAGAGVLIGVINEASSLFGSLAVCALGLRLFQQPLRHASDEVSSVVAGMST